MKRSAILAFVVLVVSFCAAQMPSQPVQYFPYAALPRQSEQEKAYTEAMQKFNEPSLLQESKLTPNVRTYRVLWSGVLAVETPIVVRLNVSVDGTGSLTVKIVNGRKQGQWGKITEKTRKISKKKVERFLTGVQKLNLANLPTYDSELPGLDGSDWLVECVENGTYTMYLRWAPRNDPVREMGRMLGRLAGADGIR